MNEQTELDIQNNPDNRGSAPQTQPVQVPIGERIEQYIALRDQIKIADENHKKRMAPARETLEVLNNIMLQHLIQIGGDSVKSASGTVYKTTKQSASLEDPDAFMSFVVEKERFELLDRKANVKAVVDFIDENGVMPPGVKLTSATVVGVRRS